MHIDHFGDKRIPGVERPQLLIQGASRSKEAATVYCETKTDARRSSQNLDPCHLHSRNDYLERLTTNPLSQVVMFSLPFLFCKV